MKGFLLQVASKGSVWTLAALLVAGTTTTSLLKADESSQGPAARLSSSEGGVRLLLGGQVAADPAPVNTPVFEGAQLTTTSDGKAEVQFEDGTVARLSPNSAMTLISLQGASGGEVSLESGLGYFEMPEGVNRQIRIRFGDTVVTAGAGAVIRIRLDTPPGEVAVFAGFARLERGNALSLNLETGQSIKLNASAPGSYKLSSSIPSDSWDQWNQDRDEALNSLATSQTGAAANAVGQGASGPAWGELDAYGSWYNMPGQGYVWSPYAASNAGWDPYGCGRWMWTPNWGYIWVSCDNWGFMPYMCGSWNYYDNFGWGWAPGMGMSCGSGMWGAGYFGGVHIGRAPSWYRMVERPGPGRPIARVPGPIHVNRRGPGMSIENLPLRTSPIQVGGQRIAPIGREHLTPGNARIVDGSTADRNTSIRVGQPHPPSMVYGGRDATGVPARSGYTHTTAPGEINGRSNVHVSQPIQMGPAGNQQQQRMVQPTRQQPQNTQPSQQIQPRVAQPPQQQHNYQPSQIPRSAPPSAPTFHSAPPASSGGGGGNPGGGAHPSSGGNQGGHR